MKPNVNVLLTLSDAKDAVVEAGRRVADERFEEIQDAVSKLSAAIQIAQPWCTHYVLAEYFGVRPQTVKNWIKGQGLPTRSKVGHQYIIDTQELSEWLLSDRGKKATKKITGSADISHSERMLQIPTGIAPSS